MDRKYKLAVAIILTVLFGISGLNVAIGGVIAGFGGAYSVGALLPFLILLLITIDQYNKLKREALNT